MLPERIWISLTDFYRENAPSLGFCKAFRLVGVCPRLAFQCILLWFIGWEGAEEEQEQEEEQEGEEEGKTS